MTDLPPSGDLKAAPTATDNPTAMTETRREVLRKLGLTTAAIAASTTLPHFSIAGAQASSRYAKYKGSTIVLSIPAHPHFDAAIKMFAQFTRETGIRVEADRIETGRMKDKQLLEMSKGRGDYDVVTFIATWKGEYVKKKLIEEMQPFLSNAALADPNYDISDVVPGYLQNIGLVGGKKGYLPGPGAKLYGLPSGAETSIMAYRKDIFASLKLKPPTTYTELEAMLPIIQDKGKIGAMTSRGKSGHDAMHGFLLHLNPMGGEVFDDNWKPVFQEAPGIKALQFMQKVVATGPKGIPSFAFGEMSNSFLQGEAAIYIDSIAIFGPAADESKSRIKGKVGYALHPKAARYSSQTGGFGLAIPANSANKEAAFLFIQWLTSKQQDLSIARLGGNAMRTSTINNGALRALYPQYAILKEQIKYANPDWRPIIPEWDALNIQIFGIAVNEGLTGKNAQAALQGAVGPVTDLMKRAGYYS
ncbi:ABC transporter substrate-binding protein [Deinococcus marmoris]|uniref:ABC transporter substrate-binding protein n=1 Tax=Deinococcus marmoris TaxID=249408 RepID=UPI000A47F013|nr:extracellular solute-binding protein [Deinococcus marmoris]